jgi:membrane protease YdiL (CAAX protease family)
MHKSAFWGGLEMWEKINKFIRSQAVLSVFLLNLFFISVLGILPLLISNMAPPARLSTYTIGQLLLSGIAIWLMRKLDVFDVNDFRFKGIGRGFLLAWFGFVYIAIAFLISFSQIPGNSYIAPRLPYLLIVVLHPFIGTGLLEEVLYRGLVLKILLGKTGSSKRGIFFACVVSSVIFGVSHIVNLLNGAPVLQTLTQMIMGMGIGLFFAAVFLRTRSLLIPILFHGLLNLSSQIFNAISTVSLDALSSPNAAAQTGTDIISFVMYTAFCTLPVLIAGLILLRKVKPDDISFART